MGFSLSDFFQYNKSTDGSANKGTVLVGDNAKNYKVVSQIRNLMPGQNISGEVVAIHDHEVQIALDKDTILMARLDRNLDIALGQTVTFEVSNVSKSQIALRPLFTNMSNDPNLLKALSAAKIPVNDSTILMVSTMMEEGMSIDKQSLLNMYKDIMTFPQNNAESIVQIKQLNIPITEDSLLQLENYKNNNYQLLNSVIDVTNEILPLFHDLLQEGNEKDAVFLARNFIQTFSLEEDSPLPTVKNNTPLTTISDHTMLQNPILNKEQVSFNDSNHLNRDSFVEETKIESLLSPKERMQLALNLEQIGLPKNLSVMIKKGNLTSNQILQVVNQLVEEPLLEKSQGIKSLLGSTEFINILKSEITNQWLMNPKKIAKEGSVGEQYQKISQQTSKMIEALNDISKTDSSLMKSVTNIQGNVDFINQLNQMFTYVQLPLKLSQQNANGDLYVYTNKKNLADEDGNISAFLHLDMDHLGTMDIYVSMQKKDVNTKFYLQDNETIDFIQNHIHTLNEKLQKRGYHMTSEMVIKEKQVKIMEVILQKEENKGNVPTLLSKYSFDVRA